MIPCRTPRPRSIPLLVALAVWALGLGVPMAHAVCGDGVLEATEQCDDGNTSTGDCCSPTCTLDPFAAPCPNLADADPCTFDFCSAQGTCLHPVDPTCNPIVCGDHNLDPGEQCDDGNTTADGNCCSATCQFEAAGTSCTDDSVACTADVCDAAGMCTHQPFCGICGDGIVDMGEQCDDGNTVDTDCCSNTCVAAPPIQTCDDGNPCTTMSFCSAGMCAPVGNPDCGLDTDHYKCYQSRITRGTPKFSPLSVHLVDQFGDVNTFVKKVATLCNPVSKNGGVIHESKAHLTCYPTKDDPPVHFQQRDVKVTNQFGVQDIRVLKPYQLCVPTEKGIAPNPPEQDSLNIDHYRCYKAKPRKGALKVDGPLVELDDQFETRRAIVKPCIRFCTPVSKNGEPIHDPDAHLTCYKLMRLRADQVPPFQPIQVNTENQFGDLALTARPLPHLCVPSLKQVVSSPSGAFLK